MHTITTATLAAASIAAQDRANATGAAWVFFSSGYGNGCYERADDLTGTCTVRCQRWHNGRLVVVVQPEAVELTARAKAFSGEAVRDHRFRIETDGTLRLSDPRPRRPRRSSWTPRRYPHRPKTRPSRPTARNRNKNRYSPAWIACPDNKTFLTHNSA